jgi:hypothetical protein
MVMGRKEKAVARVGKRSASSERPNKEAKAETEKN